jgi:hypothetical protein
VPLWLVSSVLIFLAFWKVGGGRWGRAVGDTSQEYGRIHRGIGEEIVWPAYVSAPHHHHHRRRRPFPKVRYTELTITLQKVESHSHLFKNGGVSGELTGEAVNVLGMHSPGLDWGTGEILPWATLTPRRAARSPTPDKVAHNNWVSLEASRNLGTVS